MHSAIWEDVANQLAPNFKVLLIDLPGFGQSLDLPNNFTLDEIATMILAEIQPRITEPIVVVGHSLGGYVTLAMAAQAPELFAGFCLLHSTANADSEEKKKSRTKTISFINENGVQAFTSNFITPLFANADHPSIETIRTMNMESSEAVVVGYTKAMRDRPDRKVTIESFPRPVLLVTGAKDPGIPSDSITALASLNEEAEVIILKDQAHMSLVEGAPQVSLIIDNFASRCFHNVK